MFLSCIGVRPWGGAWRAAPRLQKLGAMTRSRACIARFGAGSADPLSRGRVDASIGEKAVRQVIHFYPLAVAQGAAPPTCGSEAAATICSYRRHSLSPDPVARIRPRELRGRD
jgi:hypothetical protein